MSPTLTHKHLIRGEFPITLTLECTRKKDGEHFHNYTQMWYILSGALKQNIFGKTYIQNPGSFFLIPPYTRHSIDTSESDDTPVFVSISFIDEFLTAHGYRYFSFTQPNVRFEERDIPRLCQLTGTNRELADMLVRRMFAEFSKHYNMSYDVLRELLVEFMRILCRGEERKEDIALSKERAEAISKAVNYLSEHHSEKITIDMLCQISAMSRRVFTDSFKAVTGLTVVEFLTALRMDKVRHYILFSNKSVNEIAALNGFYDNAHLSRSFTKYYKISPTEYRKQNQRLALILDKEQAQRWSWVHDEKISPARHNG